jgi:quinoprotein relay system zinc metallohydrolase 2
LMSHVHPDHIFGASAFIEDKPEFVGHAALPNALAQRGDYYRQRLEEVLGRGAAGDIVQPSRLIDDRAEVDLGQRILQLRAHPLAHSDNDLSAFDVNTQTLFAADLLFVERIPSLDGSLKGWLRELGELRAIKPTRAVPGHGPASVSFESAARKLETYLETLMADTRRAIAAGRDIDSAPDIVGHSERDQWLLFDEYHGHNVVQAFKELEWE